MRATVLPGRTVDIASLFASAYNFDLAAGCDAATFQPCSDRALSSLKVIVERFRSLYAITRDYPTNMGNAIGLFYEDTSFDGGQPWFISTFACAELLYYALATWESLGSLNVTSTSLSFFQLFNDTVQMGQYDHQSHEYRSLRSSVHEYADSFVELAAQYTPESGVLTDMYNKTDGSPVGAPGFSWGYASALRTFAAREGVVPRSWGAKLDI